MAQLKKIKTLGSHSGAAYAICAGPEGVLMTGGADRIVGSWNQATLSPHDLSVRTDHPIFSLGFSRSHELLLIGASTGHFHWIDLAQKKEVRNFELHEKGVFSIYIHPTEPLCLTTGGEGSIALWHLEDQEMIRQIPLSDQKVRSIRFNKDHSQLAACCGDGTIHVLEYPSLNELATLRGHEKSVNVAYFASDNTMLSAGWDGHLRIWDLSTAAQIKALPAHNFAIYDIVRLPGTDSLCTASRDKTLKIWNQYSLEVEQRVDVKMGGHNRSINALCVSGDQVFSVGDDGQVIAWQIES